MKAMKIATARPGGPYKAMWWMMGPAFTSHRLAIASVVARSVVAHPCPCGVCAYTYGEGVLVRWRAPAPNPGAYWRECL